MTNKTEIMKRAWEIAREAAVKFGGSVKSYVSEAMKMAWAMIKRPCVKVGDIYNIGIGHGDSADCEVVKIDKDTAVLEMIEYGGPLMRKPITSLIK